MSLMIPHPSWSFNEFQLEVVKEIQERPDFKHFCLQLDRGDPKWEKSPRPEGIYHFVWISQDEQVHIWKVGCGTVLKRTRTREGSDPETY